MTRVINSIDIRHGVMPFVGWRYELLKNQG